MVPGTSMPGLVLTRDFGLKVNYRDDPQASYNLCLSLRSHPSQERLNFSKEMENVHRPILRPWYIRRPGITVSTSYEQSQNEHYPPIMKNTTILNLLDRIFRPLCRLRHILTSWPHPPSSTSLTNIELSQKQPSSPPTHPTSPSMGSHLLSSQ